MNSQTYSQKVGHWLHEQSGCSLLDFCIKFKYNQCAIKIMNLDETNEKQTKTIIARDKELRELYLSCNKSKTAISRKGTNRSWTQYFKDLISGWILEDLAIEMLRRQGIEVLHNGRDAQRVIAIDTNVTQDADLIVKVGGVSRKVELSNEFNPILGEKGFIEKRAPALYKLWQDKGIWVYRDLTRGKYVLVDFGTEKTTLHLRHHDTVSKEKQWTKDVHRYILAENGKIERDDRLLAPEIITVVGCSLDGKEQPKLDEVEDEDSPPRIFSAGGIFKEKTVRDKKKTNNINIDTSKEAKIQKTEKREEKKEKPQEEVRASSFQEREQITDDESQTEDIEDNNLEMEETDIDFGDSDFV